MRVIINLFILITGVSGLIYQIAWQRYLTRLLGSDSIATAIILGIFLGGLSTGYFLCGRLTLSAKNQFKTYAILEGIIGLWGLGFPLIFKLMEWVTSSWSFSYPVSIVFQGVICSVVLLGVPTICMGGTIPILTKALSPNFKDSTRTNARVYAVNTAGAFIGAVAAGFFLVPKIGLSGSVFTAAILNLAAAIFFYSLAQHGVMAGIKSVESNNNTPEYSDRDALDINQKIPSRTLYIIAFLSGFYVMALENALIRLANLSFGSSSYSFTIIVSAFILLIACGSYIVSRFRSIEKNLLWVNQVLITVSLLAVYASLDNWPYWAHLIRISCQSNAVGFVVYYILIFVFIFLALLIPVLAIGATLPIIFNEIKKDMENLGRHSGNVFSLNTLGSLSGSLIGGIFLYHFLDIRGVFLVCLCFAGFSAWLSARSLRGRYFHLSSVMMVIIIIITITAPWFAKSNFKLGTFRERVQLPYSYQGKERFFEQFTGDKEMMLYDDDTVGTYSVLEYNSIPHNRTGPVSRQMSAIVNGKSDSATYESTVSLLAHIPALLSPRKENTLVIGMGTGITAGELTLYPEVKSIDVAEISPSVIRALPLFEKYNFNVHKDPRLNILRGDAFNLLKGTDKKYDIIISEPSNPWVTGVDSLFSKEFYTLTKKRLNEGGVFVQWLHFYEASEKMIGIVANTLSRSFKYCRAYVVGNEADLIFLCSDKDMSIDNIISAERSIKNNVKVSQSLKRTGISVIEQLMAREIWSPGYISTNFSDYPLQTLDKPVLHYVAGKDFFMGELAPIEFIFNQKTASYSEDFLLAKKYQNWKDFELHGNVTSFLIHGLGQGEYLKPIDRHLNLRAYFNNPSSHSLPANLANDPVLKIIPLITGVSSDQDLWQQVGLQSAPFHIKAQKLFEIVSRTRNWIVPYPLDGLKKYLMEGIKSTENVNVKNWSILNLCQILLEDQADINKVKAAFEMAVKGNNGKIIIRPEDVWLLEKIESKINNNL